MANYSFLTTDLSLLTDKASLEALLCRGIKVIVFVPTEAVNHISLGLERFKTARLLQVFSFDKKIQPFTIEDGIADELTRKKLYELSKLVPLFNYEQYLVEHADANNSLIVEAGAGTGKTTVMIDRILFLLHTVPGLSLDEIGMITFTNEATQNMKHKIQSALMQRYRATRSYQYLQYLEDCSKIQIQTIHSFSKGIISELGTSLGYAHGIGLKSYKYEKRQLIHDVLNEKYLKTSGSVEKSLGSQLHELDDIIFSFWAQLENLGLTDNEIAELDWGKPLDSKSKALHMTLSSAYPELNKRYNNLKLDSDAIAVGDIVRELRRIMDNGIEVELKGKKLRYLFVDEFQDSDNAQIKTIAWLHKNCDTKLFAVGDVKQSIYRFRGAVETAFDRLRFQISQNTPQKPNEFTLTRNYRTSADVLNSIDPIFVSLEKRNLLEYGAGPIPQVNVPGTFNAQLVRLSKRIYQEKTVETLKKLLTECIDVAEKKGIVNSPTQHVTVLTRTNFQLHQIGMWCEDAHIPCYIKQEGTFYSAQAVKDFYCLVKGFLFPTASTHLFDYLNSAYSSVDINLQALCEKHFSPEEQHALFIEKADALGYSGFLREFRLKPVLAVLREIIDKTRPTQRFIAKRKQILAADGWAEREINHQLAVEAAQYSANLEKLLQILREHFSGQMASLYQIYEFLKLNYLTNQTEDEPDISMEMDCHFVYGMTVHKAKGLEFDTVFLPLTHRPFRRPIDTELILDGRFTPPKVGWSKVSFGDGWNEIVEHQCNDHYAECLEKEFSDIDREEARLLYVALTRTIRHLECFIIGDEPHSWASMLEV